jgi:hypothetical protein
LPSFLPSFFDFLPSSNKHTRTAAEQSFRHPSSSLTFSGENPAGWIKNRLKVPI